MATHTEFDRDTPSEDVAAAFASQVRGKVFLVTGVNSKGLGGATARALATQGPKLLILTGRGPAKFDEVAAEIKAISPNVATRFLQVDLASPESVRRAAAEVNTYPENIDIVINNAGVMALPDRTLTADGNEMQFASNHVGHFLLTNLIMSKLVAAAGVSEPGDVRVVNVSSFGHQFSPIRFSDPTLGKPTKDLPKGEQKNAELYEKIQLVDGEGTRPEQPGYDAFTAYGQSKTANVLFSLAINQKLAAKGIKSFSLHPGSIGTELTRHSDETQLADVRKHTNFHRKSLTAGASTQLVAALDPGLRADGKHIYLSDCQLIDAAPWAVSEENAERLWKMTEELVGQKFDYY